MICCTYPLVIKVCNLLAEDEVLEQRRAALPSRQDFLVLNWAANVRRQKPLGVVHFEFGQMLASEALGLPCDVADVGVGTLRLDKTKQAHGGQKYGANHCRQSSRVLG